MKQCSRTRYSVHISRRESMARRNSMQQGVLFVASATAKSIRIPNTETQQQEPTKKYQHQYTAAPLETLVPPPPPLPPSHPHTARCCPPLARMKPFEVAVAVARTISIECRSHERRSTVVGFGDVDAAQHTHTHTKPPPLMRHLCIIAL